MSLSKVVPTSSSDPSTEPSTQKPSEAEISLIRRELGFNTRNAKVLYWSVESKSPEEIAALAGISTSQVHICQRFIVKYLRFHHYERNPCTDQETMERALTAARAASLAKLHDV
jgi:DNA-binding CsgD family transcriptional regulator